jgi:hypothetical protein
MIKDECNSQTFRAGGWSVPPHPGPLPWGEGESSPVTLPNGRSEFATARSSVLPLPKGEGRGEGEGSVRKPVMRDHTNCLSDFEPRVSDLFRISDFGFRIFPS